MSDKEFNQLLKSPFENMKAKLNKWTLKGPLSLSKLILKMEIKDKDSAYKQLHMLFYVGSKGNMFITFGQIAQKIIDLKAFDPKFDNYTTKDKEEIKSGEIKDVMAELDTSIFLINHIKEKEKTSLKNIF